MADKNEAVATESTTPAKTAAKAAAAADAPATKEHVLKVHHLRPAPGAKKARTRVGRGEGSKGKTAGRGTKGTKARYQVRVGFEGGQMPAAHAHPEAARVQEPVPRRVPGREPATSSPSSTRTAATSPSATSSPRVPFARTRRSRFSATGDIAVKLNVAVDKVSGSAEQKIVAAGGSVK